MKTCTRDAPHACTKFRPIYQHKPPAWGPSKFVVASWKGVSSQEERSVLLIVTNEWVAWKYRVRVPDWLRIRTRLINCLISGLIRYLAQIKVEPDKRRHVTPAMRIYVYYVTSEGRRQYNIHISLSLMYVRFRESLLFRVLLGVMGAPRRTDEECFVRGKNTWKERYLMTWKLKEPTRISVLKYTCTILGLYHCVIKNIT